MTRVSDNAFPSILITEGTEPAAPAAGKQRLYIDSTTHKLKRTDSSGTDVTVEGGLVDTGTATYLDFTTGAAPAAPSAGTVRLYSKTGDHLYQRVSGGTETALDGAGGGGTDLVQTYSGGGSVYVPGLIGSPDAMPASPSAFDDEFNVLSGWTTLGTLDTSNVTDFPSHWHAKRTNVALAIDGIYKTAPSMPFTVTAKLNASNIPALSAGTGGGVNYNHAGILLTENAPGKCFTYGFVVNTAIIYTSVYRWTNRTTLASNIDSSTNASSTYAIRWKYLRLVVASSTDVSGFISDDGFLWYPTASQQNITTSLTVANVGLAIGDAAAAGTVEAVFDWIRFT